MMQSFTMHLDCSKRIRLSYISGIVDIWGMLDEIYSKFPNNIVNVSLQLLILQLVHLTQTEFCMHVS